MLVSLGYIGFILYVSILLMFFIDIIFSNVDRIKKSIFVGILFSVIIMNFTSNSYISRFDLAQHFAFILALFFVCRSCSEDLKVKEGISNKLDFC